MVKTETIENDLKQAMLDKQADKVSVLRMLVAGIKNARIEKGEDLNEEDEIKVLKKEAKKRTEAIEIYKKAERNELAEKEEKELQVIKKYLPEEMGAEKIKEIVLEMKAAGELGDDFGSAMKAVMGKLKGGADGKLVAGVVKQEL